MKYLLIVALLFIAACSHHKKCESCDLKKAVTESKAVEFDGHCANGLCLKKMKVKCDPTITAAYKGKHYCFSSEEARDTFMKDIDNNVKKAHESWASIIGGNPGSN
ncbi:MAG: hypothetical protein K2P81_03525 [Bacteriovoracaceae bacterium]|nr:hypothetical protein [Bacteriovoracaceae bacterium]